MRNGTLFDYCWRITSKGGKQRSSARKESKTTTAIYSVECYHVVILNENNWIEWEWTVTTYNQKHKHIKIISYWPIEKSSQFLFKLQKIFNRVATNEKVFYCHFK